MLRVTGVLQQPGLVDASSLDGRYLETRKLDASLDLREMEMHLDFRYVGQVEALKVAVAGAFRKLDF